MQVNYFVVANDARLVVAVLRFVAAMGILMVVVVFLQVLMFVTVKMMVAVLLAVLVVMALLMLVAVVLLRVMLMAVTRFQQKLEVGLDRDTTGDGALLDLHASGSRTFDHDGATVDGDVGGNVMMMAPVMGVFQEAHLIILVASWKDDC